MVSPLWTPDPERIRSTQIDRFRRFVNDRHHLDLPDTTELHRWSLAHPGRFWAAVWDHAEIIGDRGPTAFLPEPDMAAARFFPDGSLNFAENLLHGRGRRGDEPAIVAEREDGQRALISWDRLRADVGALASRFREWGLQPGDRVAAWMPNTPETVIAMLATTSIGAIFTSTSADFGAAGVVDRFGQVEPKILVAADAYTYAGKRIDRLDLLGEIRERLPTVERVIVLPNLDAELEVPDIPAATLWNDALEPHAGAPLEFPRFGFDHPGFILYSSGTTGPPKCMVHRAAGVLLKHVQEQQHHCDVKAGDTVFYFTTCGWMMWNWLTSALASGATIVLYEGNPFHPSPATLFDVTDRDNVTLLGVSAKFIDAVAKSGLHPRATHRLSHLRTICSTGSPLAPEGFEFVYEHIKDDVHLASISGGTDLCGCFVGGDPTRPVWPGELQAPTLGMGTDVFDDSGRHLDQGTGELVCTAPFPSMPLEFWNDPDGTRYRSAYFDRFPGVWTHGDFAEWTSHGGMIIHGRSDATLNAGGVRIGTAEIYRQVEQIPGVAEAIAVAQRWEGDTRIVLFVRLVDGANLDADTERAIRARLRQNASPRHVPARIVQVPDIPRTRSGKITEMAVTAIVNGEDLGNTEALANPEALDYFKDRPELSV